MVGDGVREKGRETEKEGMREVVKSCKYSSSQVFETSEVCHLPHIHTHSLYILPNALTAVIVSKPPVVTPSAATVMI